MDGRDEQGRFAKGYRGGPGGGTPGGRRLVLRKLDTWLCDEGRQDKLYAELEKWLDDDPRGFWKDLILKVLPKKFEVGGDAFGPALRVALMDILEKQVADTPPTTEGPSV